MNGKPPSASVTEQVHMVNPANLNGNKRLFGGRLLSWIDVVAGITARRHCGTNATTAAIDNLNFIAPAYPNDLVVIVGKVTYTGNTSMEVCVKSYVEQPDGTRKLINKAYVVMVALDENEKPIRVTPLLPQTDEEKAEFEAGAKRKLLRNERRKEKY